VVSERPAAVAIRGLRVVRGGTLALRDVDLEVARGSVTGLLGPSGSGKTTLMRAIVGVQIVERGDVRVLGLPGGGRELRRRVGYVTQAPSVYRDLTVRENLRYFAGVVGVGRGRVDEVLDVVALRGLADRQVGRLSGGESSRVSLATALLADPDLLVLDEPTVGLDPVLRRSLWDEFRSLAAQGTTLLVSSHVLDEAARCDDVVLLRDGAIVAQAAPDALLERTATSSLDDAFLALVEERP
jgi:ABC-2 type transport system ATP-binding protein